MTTRYETEILLFYHDDIMVSELISYGHENSTVISKTSAISTCA